MGLLVGDFISSTLFQPGRHFLNIALYSETLPPKPSVLPSSVTRSQPCIWSDGRPHLLVTHLPLTGLFPSIHSWWSNLILTSAFQRTQAHPLTYLFWFELFRQWRERKQRGRRRLGKERTYLGFFFLQILLSNEEGNWSPLETIKKSEVPILFIYLFSHSI